MGKSHVDMGFFSKHVGKKSHVDMRFSHVNMRFFPQHGVLKKSHVNMEHLFLMNWSTETCFLCPAGKSSAVVGANTTCALCGAGAYSGDSDAWYNGVYVGAGASVCQTTT
jgi:hypothetical protein